MIRAVMVCAALALAPNSAHAQFKSGNDLFTECDSAYGLGYIVGAYDALHAFYWTTDNKHLVCTPKGMTAGQLSSVVCKYMRDNPETRHYPASIIIHNSVIKAWPCR